MLRIVYRTKVDQSAIYVIQKRRFFMWKDAENTKQLNSFKRLEDAKRGLCFFDGTKEADTVVYSV